MGGGLSVRDRFGDKKSRVGVSHMVKITSQRDAAHLKWWLAHISHGVWADFCPRAAVFGAEDPFPTFADVLG